jgi:hypothetical protein
MPIAETLSAQGIEGVAQANARRIVACVNACAGSTDVELKLVADMGGFDTAAVMRWEKVRELTQQREELLADMQKAHDLILNSTPDNHGDHEAMLCLSEAIAKAQGVV